jgi:UPF0755 protein
MLALFVVSICALAAALVWTFTVLPERAEERFGPPAAGLEPLDLRIYAVQLFLNEDALTQPITSAESPQSFTIDLGDSVGVIANRLERVGLIRSADAFRLYVVYAGLDTSVQAGEYELSPNLNAMQIARVLQDATPKEITFVILNGWRAEEIAAALPTSGLEFSEADFLEIVSDPPPGVFPPGLPVMTHLEGFLHPGSYTLDREASPADAVSAFLTRFDQQVTDDIRAGFERQGLTLQQAVTLASIVQREAVDVEEAPQIASVFLNRLEIGMRLDSDPTVQYAVGYSPDSGGWWKNPLTLDDIAVVSPYNTYINTGLPPGSISNPGMSALQAVAFPAQTPYYYFRARCDGSGRHQFAVTYDEHLANACE